VVGVLPGVEEPREISGSLKGPVSLFELFSFAIRRPSLSGPDAPPHIVLDEESPYNWRSIPYDSTGTSVNVIEESADD
jgi:hypothetical protein